MLQTLESNNMEDSYSCDVVFKEVKNTPHHDYEPWDGEWNKIEFGLENRESDSMDKYRSKELDEEEELQTLSLDEIFSSKKENEKV